MIIKKLQSTIFYLIKIHELTYSLIINQNQTIFVKNFSIRDIFDIIILIIILIILIILLFSIINNTNFLKYV